MKNKACLILGVIAVILAASALCIVIVNVSNNTSMDSEFTLYIGMNDNDLEKRVLPINEIIRRVDEICSNYLDGYTLIPGFGRWTNDKGAPIEENTVICKIFDSDEETVQKIAGELLIALNQASIMIVDDTTHCTFYTN